MDARITAASRAIAPVAPILNYGPNGEAYERNGPEAQWGEGAAAARTYDARLHHAVPVVLRGVMQPPNPFLPAHHERWGAYFWLVTDHERVRILLGPVQPFTPRALRLVPDDAVDVLGYRIHLHEEDAVVAAMVVHGRERAVLLDAERHRVGGPRPGTSVT